eukprot:2846922-Ditylum_brightwellii.AAC.1
MDSNIITPAHAHKVPLLRSRCHERADICNMRFWWRQLPVLCGAVSLEGPIYAIGGFDGSSSLSSMAVFSPLSKTWASSSLPHMQTKRCACAAVAMEGSIYAIEDHNGSSSLSSMEVFSPSTNEWTLLPDMHCIVEHCTLKYMKSACMIRYRMGLTLY